MNNTKTITEKKAYKSPEILVVVLDNEISLALESTPPTYESLNGSIAPDYFSNDPFKTTNG